MSLSDYNKRAKKAMSKDFVKHDSGKPELARLSQFTKSLEGAAAVLKHGADKYGADNWKKCADVSRYHDALLRHAFALASGELVDPDSGLCHTDHIITNCLFIRELSDAKDD